MAAAREQVEVVVAGDDTVDLASAVRRLRARGLTRILSEGGPKLFASLAAAGVVDELCLTVAPLLAGPGAGRIVAGPPWDLPAPLRLSHVLEEDGALFQRLRPTTAAVPSPGGC